MRWLIGDRNILIRKLGWYGIEEVVFKNYLENRTQRVKFNGKLSEPIDVKLGVPPRIGPRTVIIFDIYK